MHHALAKMNAESGRAWWLRGVGLWWGITCNLRSLLKMSKLWSYGRGTHAIGLLPVFLRLQVVPRNNESQTGVLLRVLFLW